MRRIAAIACMAALAAIFLWIVFRAIVNPVKAERESFAADLAKVTPVEVAIDKPNWNFEKWEKSIAGKQSLWQELVAPPPPVPPPPEAPPDLQKMLQGVTATRQSVGGRAKIIKPDEPKGVFMKVGDNINGLRIKEITKTEVTLSLTWHEKELTATLPRQ